MALDSDESPGTQTREQSQLNEKLGRYKAASKADRKERVELVEEFKAFETKDHWKEAASPEKPSIPLTWYAKDSMLARVTSRAITCNVTAEHPAKFQIQNDHPFRAALVANAGSLPGVNPVQPDKSTQTDNEYAAAFLDADLQAAWEGAGVEQKLKDGAAYAATYQEAWFLTGRDETRPLFGKPARFVDLLRFDQIFIDPDATDIQEDCRYLGYEVDRTIRELRRTYGKAAKDIKPKSGKGVHGQASDDGTNEDDPNATVKLECWFLKDQSTESFEVPVMDPLTGGPLFGPDGKPITETETTPKYSHGWAKVYRCQGKILTEVEDAGVLPLHWFPWYPNPGEITAQGVLDKGRGLNHSVDQHMAATIANANLTSQNRLLVRMGALANGSASLTNLPGGIIGVDTDAPLSDVVHQMQAMPIVEAHIGLVNLHREFLDTIFGVTDLRNGRNLPRQASGAFVEEMNDSSNQRLDAIRERLERVAKEIAFDFCYYAMQEEHEQTVKLPGAQDKYVTMVPAVLDSEEFEAKYEIVVNGTRALPQDPIERDAYYERLFMSLIQMPPPIAMMRLDRSDLPDRDIIKTQLQEFFAQQQQGGAPDPNMQKAQAEIMQQQAESDVKVRQRAAEGTSDAYELVISALAKLAEASGNPLLIDRAMAMIQELPHMVQKAYQVGQIQAPAMPPEMAPGQAPAPNGMMPNGMTGGMQ